MSNLLNEKYLEKISKMEWDLKEGFVCFILALILFLFSGFWTNFIDVYWLVAIAGDFLIYSFILIGKFSFSFTQNLSIGKKSLFTTNSLLLRLARIFIYGVALNVIFYNTTFSFFNIMLSLFTIFFLSVVTFSIFTESNEHHPINKFYLRHENSIKLLIVISSLATLGIMMKLYNIYSIGGWDEGWYADITMHMFQNQNWFQPLYFDDSSGQFLLFDKPPLMFILGSIGILLFNYTTLAIKWPMGVLAGLMGVAGYFIFEHQKRIEKSTFIPPIKRSEKEEMLYESNIGPNEDTLRTNDGKIVGIIFGLSMATTWFLTFYARTAYLDAAIVAITAFTALFAVKAIDHWFYGNTKRAYVYIFLTAFINMLDLLAKAWQGLIVGPSIAIYLFAKYYQYFIPRQNLHDFLQEIKYYISKNETISKALALISSIITILTFNNFIQKVNPPLNTVCYEAITGSSTNTCITYVPNLPLNLAIITIDLWSVLVAIFVYMAVVSITELIINNLTKSLKKSRNTIDQPESFSNIPMISFTKTYLIPGLLIILSVVNGLLGAFVGAKGFEFFYDRFYVAITEIFTTYFTYDNSTATRLFYGQIVDGSFAVIISGLFVLLAIWVFTLILLAVVDTIFRLVLKVRLFYNNFATKIVAEWSLLTPLLFYGLFLGYWAWFLLFQGDIFKRDAVMLSVVGIIFAVLAYLLASIYVDVLKYIYINVFKNDLDNPYYITWTKGINKFLLFLMVTTIVIILSFYPFIAWVNFMDQYIVGHPYSIRLPGELAGVPNIPQPLTYSWLFFEYYINWRYTGKGSAYTVVDSLGGLISPLFLACIPFFISGVYAYIKKRDYATLLFYGSWTLIVLITFLPAKFQLNYYYLAIFFPYFGVSSYGLFWSLKKTPTSLSFKNFSEKMLLSIPIMLLISLSLLFPFLTTINLLQNTHNFYLFIVAFIFVVGGFIVCAMLFTRSIPESFALAFIIFYLYQNLINGGIGNTDTGFLILSAVLVAVPIYTIRDRVPLASGIFLFLIIMTPITTTAGWVHYKTQDDDKYQQSAQFILSHHGDYNGSTWVFYDAGAKYAMRFYLHGLHLANDGGTEIPISVNSSSYMDFYMSNNPQLKFFVVTTTKSGFAQATTDYSASYKWLETNFVLVNPLLDKPSWQHVQLFANKTVLTTSELNTLGIS